MAQDLWTKEQLIVGLAQYCQMPFGKIHAKNPKIIQLGNLIGRTPGACSRKLGNFASLDPELHKRNVMGLPHGAKLDKIIWNEYINDRGKLVSDSHYLVKQFLANKKPSLDTAEQLRQQEKAKTEEYRLTKTRIGQSFFRNELLACYENQCCVTAVSDTRLLIAAHIDRWSDNENDRLNPKNGLVFNPFHDKCFELGLFVIDDHYRIEVVDGLDKTKNDFLKRSLLELHGKEIKLPVRAVPDLNLLKKHRERACLE